jgi:pyocin large subunit-like protein
MSKDTATTDETVEDGAEPKQPDEATREMLLEPVLEQETKDAWGKPEKIEQHFQDHGSDFSSKDADEYTKETQLFQENALLNQYPAKIDKEGVLRIYDSETNTFGAYNSDGTARTMYKPDPSKHGYASNQDYWDAQPGDTLW